jgi:hypothetical protein
LRSSASKFSRQKPMQPSRIWAPKPAPDQPVDTGHCSCENTGSTESPLEYRFGALFQFLCRTNRREGVDHSVPRTEYSLNLKIGRTYGLRILVQRIGVISPASWCMRCSLKNACNCCSSFTTCSRQAKNIPGLQDTRTRTIHEASRACGVEPTAYKTTLTS